MKKSAITFFAIWFFVLSGFLIYLSGFHMIAFNNTKIKIDAFKRSIASSVNNQQLDSKMDLHHFLGTNCGCSRKILKYLETRKSKKDFNEYVHLIENKDQWKQKLESAGYKVEILTEESAHLNYNIESVPLFSVVRANQVLYQGGYNEQQMHNSNYKDLLIAENLKQKIETKEYPLFGCANGNLAKKLQDPLGVKYE